MFPKRAEMKAQNLKKITLKLKEGRTKKRKKREGKRRSKNNCNE